MRTRRYAGGGDTQSKIEKLQKLIDSPDTPESDKKNFREVLKQFQEKLDSEKKTDEKPKASEKKPVERKPVERKPVAKKPTTSEKPKASERKAVSNKRVIKKAKPVAKKPTPKKLPKGVQMLSKKRVVVDGKELNVDSKEFCDYLTAEFIKRKEQAKSKKGSRKKTKSVMEQVSTKIEQGVEKAIKTGIAKQKPILKKNPQVFIGKVQKLETATKNFLQQLKEVLGNDYEAKEVTETTKAINKLIEDLKKKYAKK
jgi:hypothetical protein